MGLKLERLVEKPEKRVEKRLGRVASPKGLMSLLITTKVSLKASIRATNTLSLRLQPQVSKKSMIIIDIKIQKAII